VGFQSAWAQTGKAISPEDFGAKGDGKSDDTDAFQQLGVAVTARGGGIIALRQGAIYRVGRQTAAPGSGRAFLEQPILRIARVRGLTILGNGATLKLNDALHYGAFDPITKQRFDPPAGPFQKLPYAAAVGKLVEIVDSDVIRISNLTLDGNQDGLVLGGRWGDVEIQLPATGLQMTRVSEVIVENVIARNNALDGVYLQGRNVALSGGLPDNVVLDSVRCERNGRQGMSVVGGRSLRFRRCVFASSGQGRIASRPKAGVDIEPNGKNWAVDSFFESCTFINNRQVGLLADAGNSQGLVVRDCIFWQGFAPRKGVTLGSGDAFWLRREGVLIENCQVHGNVTNLVTTARVLRSSFDDAVHKVYGRAAQTRRYLLVQAGGSFDACNFKVSGGGGLGLISAKAAIHLRNCRIIFAGQGMPSTRAVAFFSPTTILQDVTFDSGPQASRHYIYPGGAQLRGKVTVTGPSLRWGGLEGRVGNVAEPLGAR
jgi:hypothetical protein